MTMLAVARGPERSVAYKSFRDVAVFERTERLRRRTAVRGAIGMSTVFAAAIVTFWTALVMTSPPLEASLFGFPEDAGCVKAGQSLAPWFEGEARYMMRAGASRHEGFDPILGSFQNAQSLCAVGRADEAIAGLQSLANQIAKLEEHRPSAAD